MRRSDRIILLFLAGAMLCAFIPWCSDNVPVAFLSSAAAGTQQPSTEGVPRLTLDKTEVDFGVLEQESLATATVTLRNTGSAPLEIKRVLTFGWPRPFEYSLDKKEIQPGRSEKLEFQFDADNLWGKVERIMSIVSNDPINPQTSSLTIRAEVTSSVALIPQKITIRNPSTAVVHRNVIIKNVSARPLELSRIESSSDAIRTSSHPTGNDIIVDISIDAAKLAQESPPQKVVLHFSGPKPIRRTITITVVRD
jgi:hypothetical protein